MAKFDTTQTSLVHKIRWTFLLAKLMGLSNFSHNSTTNKFEISRILSHCNRCARIIVVNGIRLVLVILCTDVIVSLKYSEGDKFLVQESTILFLNKVQLLVAIMTTYSNHASNQSHLQYILNSLLRCERKLKALTKNNVPSVNLHSTLLKMRILTTALDICCTLRRPMYMSIALYEFPPVVLINKLILLSLFLEWHCIIGQLTNSYTALEEFVKIDNIPATDFHAISRICTRMYKIKRACDKYYGQFALVSFMSLIRTVVFSYEGFSAICFRYISVNSGLSVILTAFRLLLISGTAPVVDILLMGLVAERLVTQADHFRWSVLLSECRSNKTPEVQQHVDTILRQAHWEDLSIVTLFGQHINRENAFQLMFEAIFWTITLLMYCTISPVVSLLFISEFLSNGFIIFSILLLGFVVVMFHFKKCLTAK